MQQLSLEQKVRIISGADYWATCSESSVGLRSIVFSDGPIGVRGKAWDEEDRSACLPCPTALAATWDEEVVARVCEVLAAEARRKGVDVLLAPMLNMHRSPLAGRHFECFSEDPLLTGRIGAAYVRSLQSYGVGATPKHFVGNDSETGRRTLDVQVDERTLREVYLAPFELAVAAGAWVVMSAYNGLGGYTMSEHPLLSDPLKREWGFDGVVVSDWTAVRSTIAAAEGANDLAMPGPAEVWGVPLISAVRAGLVREGAIDDKVRRILRLAVRVGAVRGIAASSSTKFAPTNVALVLRDAAARSIVLVRNENSMLPLDRQVLRRIAVIGAHASEPQIQGGGSASVVPHYVVSPLEGIRAAAGAAIDISYSTGADFGEPLYPVPSELLRDPSCGEAGVEVKFIDPRGATISTEHHGGTELVWGGDPVPAASCIELRTQLRSRRDGLHQLGVIGRGIYRLEVNGKVIVDAALGFDADSVGSPACQSGAIELVAGKSVDVFLVHTVPPKAVAASLTVAIREPELPEGAEMDAAVTNARESDVAIVVVGTTPRLETEECDRRCLVLPGRQDELVRRVAEANPRTVVVVNSGAPVELGWRYDVAAVVLSWFPGQEFGNALADVLFGLREPGGRLPTTWPASQEDVPVLEVRPQDGVLAYKEGLHIGYRAWANAAASPAYPFGHGLGYTSWRYLEIDASQSVTTAEKTVVRVRVMNTGPRPGRHIVQVYLQKPDSGIERPALWLAGFAVHTAQPGEEVQVPVTLVARTFQHWSRETRRWENEFGDFRILAGSSSADLTVETHITVKPA